jgi:hypothetical protein
MCVHPAGRANLTGTRTTHQWYKVMRVFCTFLTLLLICTSKPVAAQFIYAGGNDPNGVVYGQYNVATCTFCPELFLPFDPYFLNSTYIDILPLPNGNVIFTSGSKIFIFDPPSAVPIQTLTVPSNLVIASLVIAPNGNIYCSAIQTIAGQPTGQLYQYVVATNTLTLVGSFPPQTTLIFEIFYWNGTLYAFSFDQTNPIPNTQLSSITVGNPLTATVLYSYPQTLCGAYTTTIPSGPNAGIYSQVFSNCLGDELLEFDILTNTNTVQCSTPNIEIPGVYGMGEIPAGFPPPAANCNCITDAGTLPDNSPYNVCIDGPFSFLETNGEVLDNNDILRYILFTNPSNPQGSTLAVSSTPSFVFNSAIMQTGVTYYVAAVAGNNLNGNVDPNDFCIDLSNVLTLTWQPLPQVSLTVAGNVAVCAGDCRTVNATFTGTPPFSLTYTTVSGTFSQVFANNTGSFQVCVPAGTPPGNLNVNAVSLTDANCTCD